MSEVPGPTNGPVTDFTDAYQVRHALDFILSADLYIVLGRVSQATCYGRETRAHACH